MMELIASSLRLATPLLFAGMGGIICERSGIATICLEGVMLMAAFVAATVNYFTHNPWLAMGAGMIAGVITMEIHGFLSITARADQIVSAVAVNILAAGITPFACKSLFGSPTNSSGIPMADRFQPVGPDFFQQTPLVYLALLLPFVLHFALFRTRWGLRVLAAGDGPEALSTSGVSPAKVRYLALFWGGILTSFGGTYLSIAHSSQFTRDMTAGRGFIALTAIIFGKWRPLPTMGACLFFGFTEALQIRLQSNAIMGFEIPVQAVQALPYVVTLLVLVGFIGRARPPLAIGRAN